MPLFLIPYLLVGLKSLYWAAMIGSFYPIIHYLYTTATGTSSPAINIGLVGATIFLCYVLTITAAYLTRRYQILLPIQQYIRNAANGCSSIAARLQPIIMCILVPIEVAAIIYVAFLSLWAAALLVISATLLFVEFCCSKSLSVILRGHMRTTAYIGLFWSIVLLVLVEYQHG